ncbi:MAG: cephalosporin hydroxylase [Burkholderiaceae bacterium]|nr:MAG: cephalosporin hydroxylase [Burkholderiaceae bacterium]
MNDPIQQFSDECKARAADYPGTELDHVAREFMRASTVPKYSYNFSWLSRPIIQYPQDMVAMQELIWQIKPDLIVETGIAHGGSLILSASMLALIDYCEAVETGSTLDPRACRRRVVGLDIDIRPHNRAAIEAHPLAHRIDLIQGSSVAPEIVAQVHEMAKGYSKVLVCLDSNHTHEHVLAELEAYAPLTSQGSYCCVFDTMIEDLPDGLYPDRPWGKGDNPKTAVHEYLKRLQSEGRKATDGAPLGFAIDRSIQDKLLITVAPDGYLRRI